MSQFLQIHPRNPQPRLISRVVDIIRGGGVIVYPTDSCYALGCHVGNKAAMERVRRIRQAGRDHNFTLVCNNLAEISSYARVDNATYRLLRSLTPGPYTFILQATREVPKRLQNPKRKTIGIRIPDHPVALALLESLGQPIMSSTLLLPGDDMPLNDTDEFEERLGNLVDAVVDSGNCGIEPTTVIDLVGSQPEIVRVGKGSVEAVAR
ncbi:MAG: threonylcarbamoyl-AMP synthase [Gammaproteobacteria bacterium]|nr:threonylcarbamoyl-AMP synthase [Gammaproteobacteria bacterium]NNF61928.1 threonylcarbamoyl-AMP synthase [Gammaproteobacteria bacterium]NNM19768.1 threonylcarbamoyl-AMP synthase [Gammaproteobacteria bacterium]